MNLFYYLKIFTLFLLLLPSQIVVGSNNTKVTNYPADKFGYPVHKFPAELVVTKNKPPLFFSQETSFGSVSSGLDKGDTIRVIDWGLSRNNKVLYRVDVTRNEQWIYADDTKFVKVIEEKELSDWSYVSWTKKGMIALIIGLMALFIYLINQGRILSGILTFVAFIGAELFYMKCIDVPTWFVEPVIVGWFWTIVNAILLIMFAIFQIRCADKFLSLFLYTDKVSLWGLRISIILTIAWGPFGYLILAASLLLTLVINLFKGGWKNLFYTIIGVAAMFFIHKYSVEIYEPFSTVFIWIFALAIFSSIPSSGKYETEAEGTVYNQTGHLSRTGDGRPNCIYLEDGRTIYIYDDLGNGRVQDQHGDLWDISGNDARRV